MDATDRQTHDQKTVSRRSRRQKSQEIRPRRRRTRKPRTDTQSDAGLLIGLWLATLPEGLNPVEAARAMLADEAFPENDELKIMMNEIARQPTDWQATTVKRQKQRH